MRAGGVGVTAGLIMTALALLTGGEPAVATRAPAGHWGAGPGAAAAWVSPSAAAASVSPAQPYGSQALERAPDFALVDTYGDKVRLSDFRGQIVVLHFWAEWCASCKVDLEYFQHAWETFGAEDVVVLGLAYASGGRSDVAQFLDELDITFPTVICDEETRAKYSVASLPTNFIVDRAGNIRHVSRRLMNATYWDEILQDMIAE